VTVRGAHSFFQRLLAEKLSGAFSQCTRWHSFLPFLGAPCNAHNRFVKVAPQVKPLTRDEPFVGRQLIGSKFWHGLAITMHTTILRTLQYLAQPFRMHSSCLIFHMLTILPVGTHITYQLGSPLLILRVCFCLCVVGRDMILLLCGDTSGSSEVPSNEPVILSIDPFLFIFEKRIFLGFVDKSCA
jgi:hypothetical protein